MCVAERSIEVPSWVRSSPHFEPTPIVAEEDRPFTAKLIDYRGDVRCQIGYSAANAKRGSAART